MLGVAGEGSAGAAAGGNAAAQESPKRVIDLERVGNILLVLLVIGFLFYQNYRRNLQKEEKEARKQKRKKDKEDDALEQEWQQENEGGWTQEMSDRQWEREEANYKKTKKAYEKISPEEDIPEELSDPESEHEPGEKIELNVADLHFSLPRCRVTASDPAPMNKMLVWEAEKFAEFALECGHVKIQSEHRWVWAAQGMRSNRLLYVMKKKDVGKCTIEVVQAPPPRDMADDASVKETYGEDHTKIQLIP